MNEVLEKQAAASVATTVNVQPEKDGLPPEIAALRALIERQQLLATLLGEEYQSAYDQLQELGRRKLTAELRVTALETALYAYKCPEPRQGYIEGAAEKVREESDDNLD